MCACVSLCVERVYLVSAWKEGAPIQAAKILPRNLSGIVMFRQLHCDKIHSFHSATSFLLVTIVSLMPNWRRCLISTEWVKRCRCSEPQNHMLRVKGPRPHKAQLLQLWCGPIRGRRLKRIGKNTQRPPQHTNPSKDSLTMTSPEERVRDLIKVGHLFFYDHCHYNHHFSYLHNHQHHPNDQNCPQMCLVIGKYYCITWLSHLTQPATSQKMSVHLAILLFRIENKRRSSEKTAYNQGDTQKMISTEELLVCMVKW